MKAKKKDFRFMEFVGKKAYIVMPKLAPIKRKDLILLYFANSDLTRQHYSGGNRSSIWKKIGWKFAIFNPHKANIGRNLFSDILKQADVWKNAWKVWKVPKPVQPIILSRPRQVKAYYLKGEGIGFLQHFLLIHTSTFRVLLHTPWKPGISPKSFHHLIIVYLVFALRLLGHIKLTCFSLRHFFGYW